ncbi:hypothetical protein AB0K08_13555 [Citricoccus sp. NPDC055426]|uniref:hypothetical protein n=1 Tax=Citricoccus sp. NPDC055426 TaxID=3155536 RepID=UPI0034186A43
MSTFTEVKGHNPANIRKILEMSIFIKPAEDDDEPIVAVHDETGVIVPVGYEPVGLTTKDDGASWSREQDVADVTSHGYSEPTRRDWISDVRGLGFTMQESKRSVFELHHGVDLAGVTTDANGNFYFDAPARPAGRQYRVLALGKDGSGPDAIYVARWMPLADVVENGEQAWSEGDEVRYPISLTGKVDPTFGTSFREIWGGPGLDHAEMGFPAPAAG